MLYRCFEIFKSLGGDSRSFKSNRGSLYIEVLIAITILGVLGTSLLSFFPRLLIDTNKVKRYAELGTLAKYVGNYIIRWSNFSQSSKLNYGQVIDEYSEGDQFDLTGETRINRLYFADTLVDTEVTISDLYRVSMTFWETSRVESAVVQVVVWYDTDENNVVDPGEPNVPFSVVVSEKSNI